MWKESGNRSKVILFKGKYRAKNIAWSSAPPLPIPCPLNWCCWCSISTCSQLTTCSPLSQEFLLHECSLFLKQGHQSHGLPLPQSAVTLFSFPYMRTQTPLIWLLYVPEVFLIQCGHPRFQYLFCILAQGQPSFLL